MPTTTTPKSRADAILEQTRKALAAAAPDHGERAAAMVGVLRQMGAQLPMPVEVLLTVILEGTMDALARVEGLEKVQMRYLGPHESGREYRRGQFVTLDGSMWHCNQPTTARPGDGPQWTLAVKHGRDLR